MNTYKRHRSIVEALNHVGKNDISSYLSTYALDFNPETIDMPIEAIAQEILRNAKKDGFPVDEKRDYPIVLDELETYIQSTR